MKKTVLYAAMLSLLAAVAQAQNENISWQTPATISGDSDVVTNGTLFGSWAPYNGDAASGGLLVDGVNFNANATLPGAIDDFDNGAGNGTYASPNTADSNYNNLLTAAAFGNSGNPYTISWTSMTPGHTYLVQFWVNDGRNATVNQRTETLTGGTSTSAPLAYGSGSSGPGQYVVGTFVADSSGQETITCTPGAAIPSAQFNLIQVRDITVTVVTNYQSAVLAGNPIGYWPLDLTDPNAANGLATDLSGNDNDGTYESITPSANLVAGPAPYITNAVSFNDGYVYLGSGNNPNDLIFTGATTMEAWAQPASLTPPNLGDILARGYDQNNNYQEIALRQNQSGTPYYGYFGTGGINGGQQNTSWVYLVLVNDGMHDYLYINGALVGNSPDTTGSISFAQPSNNPWAIGNGTDNGNGRLFYGNICQVAIYNRGLTAGEVLSHYYEAELNASPATSRPIIVSQPQPQSSYVGGSATFSVTAVSGLPMTNQWYKGGVLLPGQTNTTLTVSNLPLGSANYTVVVGNANGSTNAAATLSVRVPNDLEWSVNNNSGNWDTTTLDWLDLSNSEQTNFNQGDQVLFDDTPGVPTPVTLSGTVFPSVITVNSSTNNFSFSSGTISGSGSFIKEGTSTLTISSAGNFTGPVIIGNGAVVAGNSVFNSASSITISNGATMDFGGSAMTTTNLINVSGAGLNGEGALYNSGNALYDSAGQQAVDITLTGNTTFGGSSRWDLAVGSVLAGNYTLTINTSGSGYMEWDTVNANPNFGNIEITPGSQLGIKGMGASLGNPSGTITVGNGGGLTFWGSSYGANTGYSKNIACQDNTALSVRPQANSTVFNADVTMGTNVGWNYFNGGGSGQVMNGTYYLGGIEQLAIGDSAIIFSNVISGPGGFYWVNYNNEMVLAATNTYSGMTAIGSGRELALIGNGSISDSSPIFFGGTTPSSIMLDASARTDGTLTLASGQSLNGIGAVNGNLVVSPGATIEPAGTNGELSITSSTTGTIDVTTNVTLNGTTVIKLNGSGNNDEVQAGGNITYGGSLNLTNISGSPLAAGNSFQIFSAATYSGSFSGITPTTPGSGLAWNTSQLSSGVISVVSPSQPIISGTGVSGTNLVFTVTGGNSGDTLYVLTRTNLVKGSWVTNATYQYGSLGSLNVTNAINKGTPVQFFMIKGQ